MSYLAMCAEPVNYNNNNNNNIINDNKKKPLIPSSKSKTYKNQKTNHSKSIQAMREMAKNALYSQKDDDSDADENNFVPLSPPEIQPPQQPHLKPQEQNKVPVPASSVGDEPESALDYSVLPSNFVNDYYKQHTPEYNTLHGTTNSTSISNVELLKKLDNILHLLEEQTDEKSNYITEELILYVFLGIFIIFVIDSFVRVGKYVR